MPIQLDKILLDITKEKCLHPNNDDADKKEVDEAWMRVSRSNKLSVHETRSIFKVLQKKYETEKLKENTTWKLFGIMEEMYKKDVKKEIKEEQQEDVPMEEDEEYEMLDVQDEDDTQTTNANGGAVEIDSPEKSNYTNSGKTTPERDIKVQSKTLTPITGKQTPKATVSQSNKAAPVEKEEKKLLNTMISISTRQSGSGTAKNANCTAVALQKKGITLKKTSQLSSPKTAANNLGVNKATIGRPQLLEVGKTIQLPDSIKRKLSEDQQLSSQPKRQSTSSSISSTSPQISNASKAAATQVLQNANVSIVAAAQLAALKKDSEEANTNTPTQTHSINVITVPGNLNRNELTNGIVSSCTGGGATSSTAATIASSSTNGFSPRLEDIDYKHDIIFDNTNNNGLNNNSNIATKNISNNDGVPEIINLGNFDNSLPPTFFKNLCNSSRHEALGLYIANVMNRLPRRSAARLELAILRSIVDVQSDELEQ